MNITRKRPARVAVAVLTAATLALTATACNGSSSKSKSKSKSRHSSSSSYDDSSSGKKRKTHKKHASHKKHHSGHRSTKTCHYQDLDLSVQETSQAGGYLLITADAKRACFLPGNPPGITFKPKHQASAAEKRDGHRIRIGPTSEPVYAGLVAKTTKGNQGARAKGFSFGMTKNDSRTAFIGVPGGVSEDRPVVTNWHTEREDVAAAVAAR